MKTMFKPILLCSISVLLAACGSDSSTTTGAARAPQFAAQVQSVAQPVSAYYTVVQQIYVGYFGRPADAGGLAFFATSLRDLGAPTDIVGLGQAYYSNPKVQALIDVFGGSQESKDLYPGDNGVFIDAVYQNLFGRAADAGGKSFWSGAIDKGQVTRASAAISLMSSAQSTDVDVINKKAAVATRFTASLTTALSTRAYEGLAANVVVRAMLAGVTLATDINAIGPTIDSTVATLVTALPAQGMYAGTLTSSGRLFNMLVLDDDSYFGFYGTTSSPLAAVGLLQGKGSSNKGLFSASDIRDYNTAGSSYALSANYVSQTSFSGALAIPSALAFSSAGIDPAIYDYNAQAKLADVTGPWTMTVVGGPSMAITVAADGSFSGASSACAVGGILTPRARKNVFDAVVSFGAGSCALSGQPAIGVAFIYTLNQGVTRQLYIVGNNSARTIGALMYGTPTTAASAPTTLKIVDTVVGTGALASSGNTVTVHYTGWLYDGNAANLHGSKFDSSVDRGTPFSFKLGIGAVIAGWDQGVAGMRVGGKRTLIIPSSLGYGTAGAGASIPPNAALVFDVELLGVQ